MYNGNIVGVPAEGMDEVRIVAETRKKGTSTGIRYIDGIAALAAAEIEEAVKSGRKDYDLRIRLARRPSDINININDVARRFIMNKKKRIETTGPVFIGVRAEISD